MRGCGDVEDDGADGDEPGGEGADDDDDGAPNNFANLASL